jgi:hypothetical protein
MLVVTINQLPHTPPRALWRGRFLNHENPTNQKLIHTQETTKPSQKNRLDIDKGGFLW